MMACHGAACRTRSITRPRAAPDAALASPHGPAPDGAIAAIFQPRRLERPVVSPDGRLVAALLRGTSDEAGVGLWDARTGALRATLSEARSDAGLAWRPDGAALAVGRRDCGRVALYDVHTGARRELDTPGVATALAWSPDGAALALRAARGAIVVDARDGHVIATQGAGGDIEGQAFSPDGRYVAQKSYDRERDEARLLVWEPRGGTTRTLPARVSTLVELRGWSADGRTLLASEGRALVHVSVADGAETSREFTTATSPDGRRVAAMRGGSLTILDAAGTSLRDLALPPGAWASALAWSPDSARVAALTNEGWIFAWSVDEGRLLRTDRHPVRGAVELFRWTSGGDALLTAIGVLRVTPVAHPEAPPTANVACDTNVRVAWTATTLAMAPELGTFATLDLRDGALHGRVEHVRAIAASPREETLALGGDDRSVELQGATSQRLRGAPIPRSLSNVEVLETHTRDLTFSPDGTHLLAAMPEGIMWLYALPSAAPRATLQAGAHGLDRGAFSPDGAEVATVGALPRQAQRVLLWDGRSGASRGVMGALPGAPGAPSDTYTAVAYAPDGVTLALGLASGAVHLYDRATRTRTRVLRAHDGAVLALAYAPDGATLASAGDDGALRLLDAATGAVRRELTRVPSITSLAWSRDGAFVAVGGLGVQVLRASDGASLWLARCDLYRRAAVGAPPESAFVAFTPDGRYDGEAVDDLLALRIGGDLAASPLAAPSSRPALRAPGLARAFLAGR